MSKRGGFPGGANFGGMNLNKLMKEAKKMQADMEKSQEELQAMEFEATAGGGAQRRFPAEAPPLPLPAGACSRRHSFLPGGTWRAECGEAPRYIYRCPAPIPMRKPAPRPFPGKTPAWTRLRQEPIPYIL